jgi:predicted negative regulator of RcsB-dependent stress response
MDTQLPEKRNFLNLIKSNSKSLIIFGIILFLALSVYLWMDYSNKNKKIEISEEFIKAKILLTNNKNAEAAIYFKNIIDKKDKTYSPLSLFIIIDKNLESNREIISKNFDKILSISGMEKEDLNLLRLKKAIFISENSKEEEILELLNPIINSNSVWKLQSAKFLGDYYFSIKQLKKAKEFYLILLDGNNDGFDVNEIKRKINLIDNE